MVPASDDRPYAALFQYLVSGGVRSGRTSPLFTQVNSNQLAHLNQAIPSFGQLISSLGFCLLVGYGLNYCWTLVLDTRKATPCLTLLRLMIMMSTLVLLTSLTLKTWHRNADWSSRTTLFTYA